MSRQQVLKEATKEWIEKAARLYQRQFQAPEIRFDLRGQAAGQYRGGPQPCIRYNMAIAATQFDAYCQRTVPHEVAHYIMDCLYPTGSIRPHGHEWQQLMHAFGVDASRCHQYDLNGVKQRRQRRFTYTCACREHQLSTTRHNRVQSKKVEYRCNRCGEAVHLKSG